MLYYSVMKIQAITWKEAKKQLLSDPETKILYDNLEPRYKIIGKIIEKRIQRNLTQRELANKVGIKQSSVARLESGDYNPTIDFLNKVAKGFDCKLTISFEKIKNT